MTKPLASGSLRLTRRTVLGSAAGGAALVALGHPASAQEATPLASPVAEPSTAWPLYGADLSGTRAAPDGAVTAATVARLAPLWDAEVGGPASGTPVIADGVVYLGSYAGELTAFDLVAGTTIWRYETGAAVLEPNLNINLGITGSAAVVGGLVYVGDAAATVHAVDAATGAEVWRVKVDAQPAGSIWSSPIVAGGRLYVGVASISKEIGFRGSVVALDAATGDLLWQTFMVPEGTDGAGVFAVPALDEERGTLYVGTQNAYTAHPAPYGNPISVVALDAATGDLRWAHNAPPGGGAEAPTDDVGFSASPNLFSIEVDGGQRDLVGEGQKSGVYWALDRDTGEVVWQTEVSPAGPLGGMEGTSAAGGGAIAVPATNWPDPAGPAAGLISLLDAGTGAVMWTVEQGAPAASPAALSGDVVFQAGMEGILRAFAVADGAELWSADLGASVSGGIAIADGVVIVAAATPEFAPFVKAGNRVWAFGVAD